MFILIWLDPLLMSMICVDRYIRWPEVFPIANIEAATVARKLYMGWIARFGVPLRITTDQGRQFESQMFQQINTLMCIKHTITTAYHLQQNGMIEMFHRKLKTANRCYEIENWVRTIPRAF